jgi:hypothetical protein
VLLTRPPLGIATSFDLHVLSTPPAFVLSQDQTLRKIISKSLEGSLLVLISFDKSLVRSLGYSVVKVLFGPGPGDINLV